MKWHDSDQNTTERQLESTVLCENWTVLWYNYMTQGWDLN